jgi:hypothetical protein
MIVANDNAPRLTPDQYLAWEETQPEKYEYISIFYWTNIYGITFAKFILIFLSLKNLPFLNSRP